jgi:hypothetical protein
MKFDPNKASEPVPPKPGTYHFIVTDAMEGISKKGDDYIKVELKVAVADRETRMKINDWLISSPALLYKIKQFAISVGLEDQFNSGTMNASDCVGKEGFAHFDFGKPNDSGRRFLEVKNYVLPTDEQRAAAYAEPNEKEPADDEIPF